MIDLNAPNHVMNELIKPSDEHGPYHFFLYHFDIKKLEIENPQGSYQKNVLVQEIGNENTDILFNCALWKLLSMLKMINGISWLILRHFEPLKTS